MKCKQNYGRLVILNIYIPIQCSWFVTSQLNTLFTKWYYQLMAVDAGMFVKRKIRREILLQNMK